MLQVSLSFMYCYSIPYQRVYMWYTSSRNDLKLLLTVFERIHLSMLERLPSKHLIK